MKQKTRKDDVVENYHGVEVADPYRWLEDLESAETKEWVAEQNKQTGDYLASFSGRHQMKKKLTELMDYPKYSLPTKEGDYYYFHYNEGLQNQPIFYRSKGLAVTDKEVVLDPNTMSDKGTAALTNLKFSQDGAKLAYGVSVDGSDWQTIRVRDLVSGEDYPEELKWCKFSGIAWTEDGQGFFYDRYPEQDSEAQTDSNDHNKVYYHRLGTPQMDDELIFEMPERKELSFSPIVSDDHRYLILTVNNGTEPKTGIYYRKLDSDAPFTTLIKEREDLYQFLGNEGETFYFYTNYEAPKGRVVAVDLASPEKRNWREVVPEQEDAVSFVDIIHHSLVVVTMHNAYERLAIYDLDGKLLNQLPLPEFISMTDVSGKKKGTEMFLGYTSYLYPSRIKRYDFENEQLESIFEEDSVVDDAEEFETKQVFYKSKDGTTVPMFITHKKGIELNGDNPVLLYGYGGYNISITPGYSPSRKMWLEAGGVYVEANLRGGGEFGEKWHLDGILEKKQNVFDDFISAAEWLIDNKYTRPERLAIMGGSNGGLLVGACITQRPELFGAALCLVPVTDMLRFHKFTVGRFWTTEFGNAEENEDHFRFMYEYSPLHNVRKGGKYPPTLVTTADTDDRVVPLHAYKFAAELQEKHAGDAPILLRVEENAGHGLGKPTAKIIDEQVDIYSFIFKQFGMSME